MLEPWIAGLIFLIISFTVLIFINKKLRNNNYSSFILFNGSWIIVVSLYLLGSNFLPSLSEFTIIYILIYFSLSNTAYIFFRLSRSLSLRITTKVNYRISHRILKIFFFLWLLYFLYFLTSIYTSVGFREYFLANSARKIMQSLGKETEINLSYYIFGTFYCWGCLYHNLKYDRKKVLWLSIVGLSLLLTAAKMNFITAIIGGLIIIFHYRNYSYTKVLKLIIPILIGFFLFLISFSIFTGKVIDKNIGTITTWNEINNLTTGVLLYPYIYLVSAIFSLDYYINEIILRGIQNDSFFYVLTPIYKVLYKVGVVNEDPSTILPIISIDSYQPNVYTFFYEVLHDFGLFGTIIFGVFSSFIFSTLDFNVKKGGSILFYLFYATVSTCIILSVVAYKFHSTLFGIIVLIILFYIKLKRTNNVTSSF